MNWVKKEINKILFFGKLQNLDNLHGHQNGVKEDLDGIYNVLLWLFLFLGKKWIFIQVE